jgi:hypothetical protein
MTPVEVNRDIAILCQNVKKRIPLTHRNLANRQLRQSCEGERTKRPKRLEVGTDRYPEHSEAASNQRRFAGGQGHLL